MSNGPRITDYPEPMTRQSNVASLFKKGYQNLPNLWLPLACSLRAHNLLRFRVLPRTGAALRVYGSQAVYQKMAKLLGIFNA
ncbi:MAG: hypothetical protein F6J98_24945 [Moorea sp. SIO4G2]|nr:hypothetical protein [Moorena sp. SIO4G2]